MPSPSHRLDAALVLLVGLALATVLLTPHVPGVLLGNAVLLGLAASKGRIVVLDYLGLRAAPAPWSGVVTAWVLLVVGIAWLAGAATLLR
jgi:energy-coupling factor transporter transmembrane protein EcfT